MKEAKNISLPTEKRQSVFPNEAQYSRDKINSVERALNILDIVIKTVPTGITAAELRHRLNLPKSSLSYILRTLVSAKYLSFDKESKKYYLGHQILSVGLHISKSINSIWHNLAFSESDANKFLRSLSQHTKLNTSLAVLENEEIVYIANYQQTPSVQSNTMVLLGERETPHHSPFGWAILASENKHLDLVAHKYPSVKISILNDILSNVRRVGYAVEENTKLGTVKIAAPILSAHSEAIASIGVIGSLNDIKDYQSIGTAVKDEAFSLSMYIRAEAKAKIIPPSIPTAKS